MGADHSSIRLNAGATTVRCRSIQATTVRCGTPMSITRPPAASIGTPASGRSSSTTAGAASSTLVGVRTKRQVLSFVRRRIQLSYSKQVRQKRPHNDPALIPQLDDRVVALVLTKSHAALLAQTSGGLAWDRRLLGSTVRNETTLLARNVHGLLDRRPLEPELFRAVQRYPERQFATRYQKPLVVVVDREKVGFSSWYDFFPRSCCPEAGRHGTFRDCKEG